MGPTDALEAEAEAKDQRDKAEVGNEMEIESDGDKYNLSNIGKETIVPFDSSLVWNYTTRLLVSVRNKCPGFCKCLRFSKSGFAIFSNYAVHQKGPELSASHRKSMIHMSLVRKYFVYLSV